jgi:hypothetical protein
MLALFAALLSALLRLVVVQVLIVVVEVRIFLAGLLPFLTGLLSLARLLRLALILLAGGLRSIVAFVVVDHFVLRALAAQEDNASFRTRFAADDKKRTELIRTCRL